MNNNFNTETNRNHSFGKLRRKNKLNMQKEIKVLEPKNIDIKDINNINYQTNYNTIDNDNNPLHSKYNSFYSSYKNKAKNQINLNNYYTVSNDAENNNINNIKKKANPRLRPCYSALLCTKRNYNEFHNNKNNDYLLCQNCVNHRLAEEKKKRKYELAYKNYNTSALFEDKNKTYTQNKLKERLRKQEKKIKEAYNTLEKCQEYNNKDKLIQENENAPNTLNKYNRNYLYEKFKVKYDKKQQYIKENYYKYQNDERPEITNYFNKYINNPNYKAKEYGEYKPRKFSVEKYKQDLSEQINYKKYRKFKEKEDDIIKEKREYLAEVKKIEKEEEEKALKKQKMKEELIKDNLDLMNAKKAKKDKLIQEDLKYKEYFEKQNIEYNNELLNQRIKKDKMNQEFVIENQKRLNKIRRKKEEQKNEKKNYKYIDYSYEPPKQIIDQCHECHKRYPQKLLSKNSSIFSYNKK